MKIALSFVSPPERCGYLPEQTWRLHYDIAESVTIEEYEALMLKGWRRFGRSLFQPKCEGCQQCLSLRVDVAEFKANRSQMRAFKSNPDIKLVISEPTVDDARLALYDKYHAFQTDHVGWSHKELESEDSYFESFCSNPFLTEEWAYYLGDQLIAIGFVDHLKNSLSAIYYFYDPELRDRSLGTFNVMSVINKAASMNMPYIYLGYYVQGCRSLEYKAKFKPNQVFDLKAKTWNDYNA